MDLGAGKAGKVAGRRGRYLLAVCADLGRSEVPLWAWTWWAWYGEQVGRELEILCHTAGQGSPSARPHLPAPQERSSFLGESWPLPGSVGAAGRPGP